MNLLLSKYYFPVIVFLFCILRLITLDLQPLSLDELTTVNLLSTTKGLPFVLEWIRDHDTQLPLYYIFEYFIYHYIGNSIFTLRLPSFIFTILGIYAAYSYCDKNLKKFVCLFLLTSFILTFHSQEIRPYGLLFLLSTLSFSWFNNRSKSFLFYIALILLSLTHYYGLALALILLFLRTIQIIKNGKFNKKLIVFLIIPLGLIAIIFGKDIYTDFLVIHPFREQLSIKSLLGIVIYLAGGKLLFLTALLITTAHMLKEKFTLKLNHMYLSSIILLAVAIIKSLLSTPALEARYFIGLMLPITLLIARLTTSDLKKIIIIVLAIFNTYIHEAITKKPYRIATKEASDYIKSNDREDMFITSCDINLKYYLPKFSDCYFGGCNISSSLEVIYVSMTKNRYDCQTFKQLQQTHKKVKTEDFKGLQVLHYKKK